MSELWTQEENKGYFQESLANFMHDAASGGAIRHMVDLGCSTDEIMKRLDFPTPRERVEQIVLEHLMSSGILLGELPVSPGELQEVKFARMPERELSVLLQKYLEKNGEENSYLACRFGMIRRDRRARLQKMFSCLTTREREYLLGIPWQMRPMYHRLNSRMSEIAVCMAACWDFAPEFYFLKSREIVSVGKES